MNDSEINHVVYSLMQRNEKLCHSRRHEEMVLVGGFCNFEKEMGENIRGYDVIITKWKNSIRSKIAASSVVYDSDPTDKRERRPVGKHCDTWDLYDPELEHDWYRFELFDMYNLLNPQQRNQHQLR
nr:hypothetical protein [Tanacetum cinerariifolium]